MRCLVLGARLAASLFVLALALPATAQEFRGSITGKISDSSGAILPGVTITATNVDTGGKTTAVTNGEGVYFIPFLQPGKYTVAAELMGFKSVKRDDVEVRIGDKLSIDLALPIGQREEVVTVEAVSPLLEVTSASQGQVIDEKRISLLPLSDGNPFTLARIVPGVAYTGDLKFSRPFDNGGTSGIVADGTTGGPEFTLDGSPNMASGRRVAFVPPAGAVSEFKVETANFDAQQGHTAGANINVAIKSGTNLLKGEGYWYYRDDKLSKNDFFLIRQNQPKAALGYDRFGGHAGGPVKKNRTFVFGAVEWLYDEFPEPGQFTVPTAKMRNGDLSELLPAGIIIYDPTTAVRRADGRIERQPFPGNIIPPEKISAISREFMKYYPLPNQAGTAQQQNNYISSNPRTDDFYSISLRGDHRITDQQNLFVRYTRNDRTEARGAWAGEVNGIRPIGNYLYRVNDGVTVDHVWSLSPSALLNVRGGWQRFQEPNVRQHEGQFDTASLGFPASTTALFVDSDYLPRFTIDGMTSIGENKGGTTLHSIYSFQPTYTKVSGNHTLRAGYDYRLYKEPGFGTGAAAGQYDFASNYTRQLDNSSAAVTGQQFAAFLLGQPTGGTIDRNADRLNYSPYQGLWFQDDWKISSKLSVNLGLRYEYEGATYESENRNVRGFDPAATLAITSAAQAAYAAAPIPEIPAANFRVLGGLQFADSNNRGFWNADKNNWAPRLGFAYRLNDRTVVRGGLGVYTVPFVISGNSQPGFSQSTPLLPSNDVGLTFQANLANPFPSGVQEPAGASAGPNTFLGRGIGRLALVDGVSNARNGRWALTVQRELPGSWLVELGYVGSKGWNQTVDVTLNAIPAQYLSTSKVRDDATNNFLTTQVTNPFRGLIPGTNHNNNTIARSQLLRPFPQFTDVTTWNYNGSTIYHSMQSRVERRFTQGYTLLFAYMYSQFKERVSYLNATDTELEERLADADVPHRFSFSGIYELPFGQGKKFGTDAGKVLNGIIGDWTVTAIVQIQSGRPVGLGNAYFNGDPSALKASYSDNVDVPVFDLSGFYFHDAAVQTNGVDDPVKQRNDPRINLVSNLRYFPSRLGNLRSQALNEWQLSFVKRVHISRTLRGQFNLELLNAFNQTIYSAPNTDPRNANFGKVTSQFNLPGSMQIAFKLLF